MYCLDPSLFVAVQTNNLPSTLNSCATYNDYLILRKLIRRMIIDMISEYNSNFINSKSLNYIVFIINF